VKDQVGAAERVQRALTDQAVGVGDEANQHVIGQLIACCAD
jgi:hypothetical protein